MGNNTKGKKAICFIHCVLGFGAEFAVRSSKLPDSGSVDRLGKKRRRSTGQAKQSAPWYFNGDR